MDQVSPWEKCSLLDRKKTGPNACCSLVKDEQSTPVLILIPAGGGGHWSRLPVLMSCCLAAPADKHHLLEPEDGAQEHGVLVPELGELSLNYQD